MNEDNKITCIIVDDEPGYLEILNDYITVVPFLRLEAFFSHSIDALIWLQDHFIDLIFLEIKMPLLSGPQLVRTLRNPPKIIFTSANKKDVFEGIDLDAIDFLMKPFSFERFIKAINKVTSTTVELNGESTGPGHGELPESFRYFKTERKMVKVNLDDILFFESCKDYIKVVTKTGTIVTRQSISSMEKTLPKHLFFRIHRSFIVSFKKIDCFTPEKIEIAKYSLPVSRLYRHELENRLK